MRGQFVKVIAAIVTMAAAPAWAADAVTGPALSEKHFCNGCHQIEAKVVGPAFKDVAAKYKGDKNDKSASAKLAASIRKGSSGVWGAVPMPPNEGVSEEEAKVLAAWILGL